MATQQQITEAVRRRAAFVQTSSPATSQEQTRLGRFKYVCIHKIKLIRERLQNWKRVLNTKIAQLKVVFHVVKWKQLSKDAGLWTVDAAIEGFIINFGTHFLFGLPITPFTILAYGFITRIVQDYVVELAGRLRHGHPPISPK